MTIANPVSYGKASAALLLGGAMWGVYWVPIRWIGEVGLSGPWAGISLFSVAILCLLPFLWNQSQSFRHQWKSVIWSGLFTGTAFGLYTIALFHTDVVRAILLFYLTPVWSTILGLIFLSERLSVHRVIGLILGLSGLAIVLGIGTQIPLPQNFGDWIALASGVAWALGTLGLYQSNDTTITNQIFGFLCGGLFVTALAAVLMQEQLPVLQSSSQFLRMSMLVPLAALFILPMVWLTVWPATLLSPARVGLLLMSEVVVGLISAALFADEPFGWREAVGAICIVGAAVAELTNTGSARNPT